MMPKNSQIQAATVDDAPLLLDIIVRAFEEYRGKFDPPSGVFVETTASIRAKVESGGGFIAVREGQVLGVVLYQPESDHMYLGRLAVLPESRGLGVASRLVGAVERRALELGFTEVQLGVRLALSGNQALFERLGYHIFEHRSHEGYSEITTVQMKKQLR